jgi:hypothetical protein
MIDKPEFGYAPGNCFGIGKGNDDNYHGNSQYLSPLLVGRMATFVIVEQITSLAINGSKISGNLLFT